MLEIVKYVKKNFLHVTPKCQIKCQINNNCGKIK